MTAPPAVSAAEEYPIQRVRFVGGRTHHRTKRPVDDRWNEDPLEAACGKTGYLASGYSMGGITPCRGCQKAIGDS